MTRRTVTGNDDEFVLVGDVVYEDIRICGDYLLLGRYFVILLELEISNGTGQRKVTWEQRVNLPKSVSVTRRKPIPFTRPYSM